jgi:hypothetical protein
MGSIVFDIGYQSQLFQVTFAYPRHEEHVDEVGCHQSEAQLNC